LVSRHRDRPSNNRTPADIASLALCIIRERYADFGPTLACEKLRECHGLSLAPETIRKLMLAVGLWIPRKLRPPKVYQPRNRRHCVGELIQIDGSDHALVRRSRTGLHAAGVYRRCDHLKPSGTLCRTLASGAGVGKCEPPLQAVT
jgi:hypothetical protein